MSYSYRLSTLPGVPEEVIKEYEHLVEQNLFERTGYITGDGNRSKMYFNGQHNVVLTMVTEEVNGHECFTITVS
jgi:hypothetical protein